ncbi:hypothetical protein [Bacillus sp. FJAT-22090]|uniref:hypothetical protein n=1 Tax=Bacillus sp. FJAT-22090 TaxID=1581038 RepID=UPI0011A49360|nr:hypothetical protein [Bacillus sp. FJAT-22090]
MAEQHFERPVAMPNKIYADMKQWLDEGELKSPQHQEFLYCFYWVIAYLWGFAKYGEKGFTMSDIKQILGYNPNEKRVNYIIKQDGLLDQKGYTDTVNDYPVLWHMKDGEDISFTMLSDYDELDRELVNKFKTPKPFVKAPLLSIGEDNDGLYWNAENSHIVRGEIVVACMANEKLKCAGIYLYGILLMMRDKNLHFHDTDEFQCSNSTLEKLTRWSNQKVIKVVKGLVEADLIEKNQKVKKKGEVNVYKIK